MDRLKPDQLYCHPCRKSSLHSNMDRLKLISPPNLIHLITGLHSNMDRLKPVHKIGQGRAD